MSESNSSHVKGLHNFLANIDCLNKIYEHTNRFNIFDVLKIAKTEIRHSNTIAWLLDPNENHGLNEKILLGLVKNIASHLDVESSIKLLSIDLNDFKVYREKYNIDILLVSTKNKVVICIENKVCSYEHGDQLNYYKGIVENSYKDFNKYYIYLTARNDEPSDGENWKKFSYEKLVNIIDEAIKDNEIISVEVYYFLKNYIEIVRYNVLENKELIDICQKIYNDHSKALDLIYEYKPDHREEYKTFILDYLKRCDLFNSRFNLNEGCSNNEHIRFTSYILDEKIPQSSTKTSGWDTKNHYFYEIYNDGFSIYLQLAISKGSLSTDEANNKFEKIIKKLKCKNNKVNWKWKVLIKYDVCDYRGYEDVADAKKDIKLELDKNLKKIIELENNNFKTL